MSPGRAFASMVGGLVVAVLGFAALFGAAINEDAAVGVLVGGTVAIPGAIAGGLIALRLSRGQEIKIGSSR